MKHALLALAIAGVVTVPTLSHAADAGFFVNGAIGRSDFKQSPFNDSDIGYYANVGYRWAAAPSALIGIEGGYTDLGTFNGKIGVTYIEPLPNGGSSFEFVPAKLKMKAGTLGANGHFNVTPQWYLSARGGYARIDSSIRSAAYGWSASANGWYAGAGFGYDFASNLSVGVNYDHYQGKKGANEHKANLLSAGAEVRF